MSLIELYNTPNDPEFFRIWSFANLDSHNQITAALQAKGTMLPIFPLWPISQEDLQGFLLRHQQVHNAMDAALGLLSEDYTNIDFQQPDVVAQVLYLHAEDHRQAHQMLGI